jgi:hypothetical protein
MKHLTLLVLVMLLGVQAFGQKKKKLDPEEAAIKIDSLTLVNTHLKAQLDSVSKRLTAHEVMYSAVKDKVIHHDFDPAHAGDLIDSLKTNRDKTMSGLTSESQALTDTVNFLKVENTKLKESVKSWENRSAENEQVVADLTQLKSLLDQKIITQEEFDQRKAKLMAKWK